jgi:hypothetical protein
MRLSRRGVRIELAEDVGEVLSPVRLRAWAARVDRDRAPLTEPRATPASGAGEEGDGGAGS